MDAVTKYSACCIKALQIMKVCRETSVLSTLCSTAKFHFFPYNLLILKEVRKAHYDSVTVKILSHTSIMQNSNKRYDVSYKKWNTIVLQSELTGKELGHARGARVFRKSGSHLKILGATGVTRGISHTEDTETLCIIAVQSPFVRDLCTPVVR